MADAELHIHINRPVDVAELSKLLDAAIELKGGGEVKQVVPDGYHCVECYADDGTHQKTCSIYLAHKAKAAMA